jgi:IS4 transposase
MWVQPVVDRFEQQAPIAVMVRAALENALSAERLDAIFTKHAQRQVNRDLLFSTVAEIMGLVACRIHPSVHAAFQAHGEKVGVTAKALYDKLQRMEPNLSRQLVRETAQRLSQVVRQMGGTRSRLLPGYRVKILDGNHLRRTQRRIGPLRTLNAAPLPGHALVVLDPETGLILDAFPCEDGHAQERTLLPQVLETVEAKDVWIDDRNFCTADFLFGISDRQAFFVTRHHAQSPSCELSGRRRRVGRCETGMVYEQAIQIFHPDGRSQLVRRITVKLDQPTRDGETRIHILTNLPKKVSALKIAQLYRGRWTIETAFQQVALNLQGEIETLGYPKAALFSFCTALVAFNLLNVVLAAMRAAHGEEQIEDQVSIYYMANEVAHTHQGLTIALPNDYWTKRYADLTPTQLARELLRIAKTVNLLRYRKHNRGPKKKTKTLNKKRRNHVSTARILAANTS